MCEESVNHFLVMEEYCLILSALGVCGSGVEPASCRATGLIPLVCMSKCPEVQVQDTEPQIAPDGLVGTLHGSHHHQCRNVCMNHCESPLMY